YIERTEQPRTCGPSKLSSHCSIKPNHPTWSKAAISKLNRLANTLAGCHAFVPFIVACRMIEKPVARTTKGCDQLTNSQQPPHAIILAPRCRAQVLALIVQESGMRVIFG